MTVTLKLENKITVYYIHSLDGGGTTQRQDFINALNKIGRKYNKALEWCAGLGAIGYSLLDQGICSEIAFADIHPPAIEWVNNTAKFNDIENVVTSYLSPTIGSLPKGLKWDLVVANPPHCNSILTLQNYYDQNNFDVDDETVTIANRLVSDPGWVIHEEFFKNISDYLTPDADIFLSETMPHPELIEIATQNKLRYIGSYAAPVLAISAGTNASLMHFKPL